MSLYNVLGTNEDGDPPEKHRLSSDWERMIRDIKETTSYAPKMQLLQAMMTKRKDLVRFCTRGTFSGEWNKLGMTGYGKYTFPYGTEYEGGFEDGMFHGEGTLLYPMGQKLEGLWEKGKMIAYKFSNVDGLDYSDNWTYCTMPDRRFNVSIREGLQPAGREFMTNQQPERPIEPGSYDTGDGFYNPVTRSIIMARDPEDYAHLEDAETMAAEKDDFWVNSVTMVSDERHQWIIDHCRKGWDEPAGYRPDLYEDWITGRESELIELEEKYEESTRRSSADDSGGAATDPTSNLETDH